MEPMEFETIYRCGPRTHWYLFFKYCWWLIILFAGLAWTTWSMYFGNLNAPVSQFLSEHPDWYLDTSTFTLWTGLAALGVLIVAYLRVSVMYRQYSFYLDNHAFHLKRGLIRIQEITIPYSQISNVHIEQPYHWRLLGLAQLDITISSSRNALRVKHKSDFLIPCIDKSLARELSHFLVRRASGEEDEEDEYGEEDDGEDAEIRS